MRVLRLQSAARAVLSVRPITRRLPGTDLEYRIRHLESVLVADEIFNRRTYDDAFAGIDVSTFIDVGSNVGYFPVFAAARTGRRDLVGLVVDANESMAKESSWHVAHNGLTRNVVVHGLVGYPSDQRNATFFLNASNVASSAQPVENPNVPSKGKTRKVTVPTIDLLAEWRKIAGGSRIDLLKIDVEGFEVQVLRTIGLVL
ncbi:MAG TPA: FkbM family methyltransferase, partial [Polyangiaceae bacterium]